MSDTMSLPQIVQIGLESTPGQSPVGGSNIQLSALNLTMDPDFGHNEYAGAGYVFDTVSVPSQEKSKLKGDGPMTYTEMVYPQSGAYGNATITTPAGGINARLWTYARSLTGVVTPPTFQIQKGDSVQSRQVNYGTFTDFGFAASRKETKISVAGFAQQMQDGITKTASPTQIPLIPIAPNDWKVYLDFSSANLGMTKLTRCFAANFGYTGAYGDAWPMDRDLPSFATIANIKPSLAVSLMLAADSSTMLTNLWAAARQMGKLYIRYEAVSKRMIDNYQTLTISGTPTGGNFKLTYKGQQTANIAYNASAANVQTALEALSSIGVGNVTCTGGPLPGTGVTITFTGLLANDTSLLTSADSLTGGTSPATAIVQTAIPYSYTHDVCCQPAPDAYQDTEGIWTQLWNFIVLGDPNWTTGNASGTAVMTKVVTDRTAL